MNTLVPQTNQSAIPEGYLKMNKRNSDSNTLIKPFLDDPKANTEKKIAVLEQSNFD
jgi:hypothetical protein